MAGTIWIPEAEQLTPNPSGGSGTMDGKGGPRATAHVTVSNPGSFNAMDDVLTGKAAESHVLYDMSGDRLGQYFPLNKSARALMGGNGTQTGISHNKHGLVNIQIEICWDPADGDLTLDPRWAADRPNWQAFLRAVRSWGIEDRFIYRTARTSSDRVNVERSVNTWLSDAGGGCWWGHCHYDELESHWDPGPLNEARFFGGADMALTADDIKRLWNFDGVLTRWSTADDATNPTWGVVGFLGYLGQWVVQARDAAVANGKALTALAALLKDVHDDLNAEQLFALIKDIHEDVGAVRLLAEHTLAQAQQNGEKITALNAATAEAIEAGVRAGLQSMIDSVENDTTLVVKTGPTDLPAGLTDGKA